MQFNVTVTEEDNKKTFTVDLGTVRKTRDFKSYHCSEVCENLAANNNLEGYELVKGTSKISRQEGRSVGTYVFAKKNIVATKKTPNKKARSVKKSTKSTIATRTTIEE